MQAEKFSEPPKRLKKYEETERWAEEGTRWAGRVENSG